MMLHASKAIRMSLARPMSSSAFLEKSRQILDEANAQSLKVETVAKEWLEKENNDRLPKDGVYKHPYCTEEYPIALHGNHLFRNLMETLGPEQVSPHFNSIEEFGKWFNYFFVFLAFTVSMRSHQNHAFGYCALNMMFGLEVWLYVLAIYMMRCTAMIAPNPWKVLWKKYNMDSMMNSVYELEENNAFEKRKEPLAQVDYWRLHNEFLGTKAELLNKYLETSRLLLKKHTYERTVSILRSTERFEGDNLNKLLKNMLEEAVNKVSEEVKGGNAADIRKQAFESAIKGIKQGKMTYEGDPLLPIVLSQIEDFKEKAQNMTAEETAKLLGLTPEQKESLKSADRKAEERFLHSLPPFKHPRILASPNFKALSA